MAYEHFYQFYDVLMEDVPYQKYIDLVKRYASKQDLILDVGCGTGNVLVALNDAGHIVDGLDISDEMLLITSEKLQDKKISSTLFCDDMRNIEINYHYQIIYSFLDTMNYLSNKFDLTKTFHNIYNALTEDGYFLFDVHSLYKVKHIFDGYSFNETRDEITYLWNTFVSNEATHSEIEHELSFFIKQKNNLYKRVDEYHLQVVFSLNEYIKILEKIGFTIEKLIFDFDESKTSENCEKIIFVSKKCRL